MIKSDFFKNRNKVFIVAELSANHNGKLEIAIETVKAAARAGADAIKLQTYTADTMTIDSKKNDFIINNGSIWDGEKFYDLYNKAHTPWGWHEKLFETAKKEGLICFSTPFDKTAVDFLESINCKAYKIASPEITDVGLIEYAAKTKKPIIVSTGLANEKDLDLAIKTIKKIHSNFAILKCTSAYPTPPGQLNLKAIPFLKGKYGCAVGFSDHTKGYVAAKTAVALGATIIEKHFKLDKDYSSIDSHFSANLSEIPALTNDLNTITECIGNETMEIPKSALASMSGRRSLYVVKDIQAGEYFTKENVRSIRPFYGLHPRYLKQIITKKASVNIKAGTKLTSELVVDFEN